MVKLGILVVFITQPEDALNPKLTPLESPDGSGTHKSHLVTIHSWCG